MGLFDKKPEVSMTGTEYIRFLEYKKKNKRKFSKREKDGILILGLSCFGLILAGALISHVTYTPPVQGVFHNWYSIAPNIATMSWNNIAKMSFVLAAPFLLIVGGLSWAFHGVQLRILA